MERLERKLERVERERDRLRQEDERLKHFNEKTTSPHSWLLAKSSDVIEVVIVESNSIDGMREVA